MPLSNIKASPTLEPLVALIANIVDEVLAESGVAATSFATLADKTTANLPVLNGPLALAIAGLADQATATAHYSDHTNPHATTATQVGAIPTGGLKTVNGNSLEGGGNISISAGSSTLATATDVASFDLPSTNSPLSNALNNKASKLGPVNLGAGAIALTASANANRDNSSTTTTNRTVTIDTTGGVIGDIYQVAHDGPGGTITMPGVAGYGYTLNITSGNVGAVIWRGGSVFHSLTPAPLPAGGTAGNVLTWDGTNWVSATPTGGGGSVAVPISISGSTTIGATLTATRGANWTGGFQWRAAGANISGATSATYATTLGSTAYDCVLGGSYVSNTITTVAAIVGHTEDFVRANSATVMGNLQTWTQHAGVWGTNSNHGYCTTLDDSMCWASWDTGLGGVGMAVTFTFATGSAGNKAGLIFGMGGVNDWIALVCNSSDGNMSIQNYAVGGGGPLQFGSTGLFVPGDSITVKKNFTTGDISVYNGTTHLPILDCNFGGGNGTVFGTGRVGLMFSGTAAGDSFSAMSVVAYP